MQSVKIPEILLPAKGYDLKCWAVNACDQYTSDISYWQEVEKLTSGKVSAYHIIFPEIYLKDGAQKRIEKINTEMRRYLEEGVFETFKGLILVERTTRSGTRTGIVLAIDLEDYSFGRGAKTLIRSTEATVPERIPPRVAIRRDAPVELPHVMLLYDDGADIVLKSVRRGKVLYDFDLMCGGGHVRGTAIKNPEDVVDAFDALCTGGPVGNDGLLFAVGDGNHSLAAAKTCWEDIKKNLTESERLVHPARFALCEAVNIYDSALSFKPIHRYIKCADVEKFVKNLKTSGSGRAYIVVSGKRSEIPFNADIPRGIRDLDGYIGGYISENGGEVDYIHGDAELTEFTKNCGVGVILPSIEKRNFFRLIISGGNLPRKTFSMGGGDEKRYYIEARKIIV